MEPMQAQIQEMRSRNAAREQQLMEKVRKLRAYPPPPLPAMRNLHAQRLRDAEAELERHRCPARCMRIENIVCEYTSGINKRHTLRERERHIKQLNEEEAEEGVPEAACGCNAPVCMGEAGDVVCTECGCSAPSLDVVTESQSTETQLYHYKHKRYAASVLETLTGSKRDGLVPDKVVQAVMDHLIKIEQVRAVDQVTVGMIGVALDNVTIVDAAGKQVRGRKYLKNRTEIFCTVTGQPPPVLVPRVMDAVIGLFGAVVQGPYSTWLERKHVNSDTTPRHNFQAYQSFLKNAVQTEIFRLTQEDPLHMDVDSLRLLGTLDVFMDSACPSMHLPEHDLAWTWCIQQLYPDLGFTKDCLAWPQARKRKAH